MLLFTSLLFCIAIGRSQAALISPTSIINEEEIYNISSSNQNDKIICSKSKCKVICDVIDACYRININASASAVFDLECSNQGSCQEISILKPATSFNTITCTHKLACSNAQFDFIYPSDSSSLPQVNITCDQKIETNPYLAENVSPCEEAEISVANANLTVNCGLRGCSDGSVYAYNSMNSIIINANDQYAIASMDITCPLAAECIINCNGPKQSCHTANINIPNRMYEYLQINGIFEYSSISKNEISVTCNYNNNQKSVLSPSSINDELTCGTDIISITDPSSLYDCCPFQYIDSILTCSSGNDCHYNCSDPTIFCANSIIDGSDASSLTVICDSEYSCLGTRIKCPSADYSSITINCKNNAACRSMIVEGNQATYIDSFLLICNDDYGNCQYIWIIFDFITMNELSMRFDGGYSAYLAVVEFSDNVNTINTISIGCDEACSSISIPSSEEHSKIIVDHLSLYCGDCGDFHLIVKKSMTINCNRNALSLSSNACAGIFDIDLLDTSAVVNIYCDSNLVNSPSCHGNFSINQPSEINTNVINVNCTTYQSCEGGMFNFTNINQVKFNCLNVGACQNAVIIADTSDYLSVDCDSLYLTALYGACEATTVYCPSEIEESCSINCGGGYDANVCESLVIYSTDDYTSNYLKLWCREGYCDNVRVGCKDGYTEKLDHVSYHGYSCEYDGTWCCPWTDDETGNDDDDDEGKGSISSQDDQHGNVAGIVIGVIVAVVIIMILVYFGGKYRKKRKGKHGFNYQDTATHQDDGL